MIRQTEVNGARTRSQYTPYRAIPGLHNGRCVVMSQAIVIGYRLLEQGFPDYPVWEKPIGPSQKRHRRTWSRKHREAGHRLKKGGILTASHRWCADCQTGGRKKKNTPYNQSTLLMIARVQSF